MAGYNSWLNRISSLTIESVQAILLSLIACIFYGVAINLAAYKLQGISGITITTGSLFFSSIILLPFAVLTSPEVIPQGTIWLSVLALGVVCTGFGYILFYRLIVKIGSQQAIMTTYLIPLFSILWGNLFLAETVTLFMLFGGIMVLFGVGMMSGKFLGITIEDARK